MLGVKVFSKSHKNHWKILRQRVISNSYFLKIILASGWTMAGDEVRIKIKEPIGDDFRWWLELSDNG